MMVNEKSTQNPKISNRLSLLFLKLWKSIQYGWSILWPFKSGGRIRFGGMMLLFNVILILNLALAILSAVFVGQVEHMHYADKNLSIIRMICDYGVQESDTLTPDHLMKDITNADVDSAFIVCIADSANRILACNEARYVQDTIHYGEKNIISDLKNLEVYDLNFGDQFCFCMDDAIAGTPWHVSIIQGSSTFLRGYKVLWSMLKQLFWFYILLIAVLDGVILFVNGRIMNKYKQIEGERDAAARIQKQMVPSSFSIFPEKHGYNLQGMVKPAKFIGGDLFDYVLRDDQLFFCIGDVSGKGMPAALMMSQIHGLFRHVIRFTQDPAMICSSLNDSLSDGNDNVMFCTFFVGIIDFDTHTLRYCNAGHNAPVLLDGSGKAGFLPTHINIALGIVEHFAYQSQQLPFGSGTSLVMYTDGVTEAESLDNQFLGDDTLLEILNGQQGLNPQDIISLVTERIGEHTKYAEQSDDITMLILKREGQHRQNAPKKR